MLTGKTILITGSGKGIGATAARLAVGYGASVVLHDRGDHDHLRKVADELKAPYVIFDITDPDAVERGIREAVDKVGRIHCLANVAGSVCHKPFEELSPGDWQRMVGVNLIGASYVTKALVPHLREHGGGRIVNVASMRGHGSATSPVNVAYGAAKAGLINMTKALAKSLAPTIQVNSVSPGPVEGTAISADWTPEAIERYKRSPIGRLITKEEVAESILFLLSDRVQAVTGADLIIDGGFSLGS